MLEGLSKSLRRHYLQFHFCSQLYNSKVLAFVDVEAKYGKDSDGSFSGSV